MGKCANDLMYNIPIWTLQTKATIHTFAHLHIRTSQSICTFTHSHIHKVFAHSHIRTFPKHLHIHTFAHLHIS